MKKISLLPIIILLPVVLFAQKPVSGDMGVTFGINGLSTVNLTTNFGSGSTLLFRYYLKDDLAVRARLNLTINSATTEQSDTSGNSQKDVLKNNAFSLNLGVQKDFGTGLKHLEPYITAELVIGSGKSGIDENTTVTKKGNVTTTEVVKTDPGNTFSFGIQSNAGFNYFFTDHFAVGAEFGYGLAFTSTGSGKTTTTTTVTTSSSSTTTSSSESTPKYHTFGLGGLGGQGLIMVSYFFGK